jgi:hypothetical protein
LAQAFQGTRGGERRWSELARGVGGAWQGARAGEAAAAEDVEGAQGEDHEGDEEEGEAVPVGAEVGEHAGEDRARRGAGKVYRVYPGAGVPMAGCGAPWLTRARS